MSDLRVRQALLHATNAKQVVDTLFSANYPQATSAIASTAAGYVNLSDKLTFDQAQAGSCSMKPGGNRPPTGSEREASAWR